MATKKPTNEAPAENTTEEAAPASAEAPAASTAPKPEPLKKISVQTVFGQKPKEWFRANKAKIEEHCAKHTTLHMVRIWGKVVKTKTESSDYGDFIRFQGVFYGVSSLDGRYYRAGQCLLPKWLELEVDSAYSEQGDVVYFGYDIFIKLAPDASLGYEYVAESITEVKTDMSLIEEKFPELPVNPGTLMLTDQSAKAA
jgi:hypothetical protein